MENKITLPVSLNPGLKAWGLTTMNSLRKSLEENDANKKGGKKIKVIRNKNKLNNQESSQSLEEEYIFSNQTGGSFFTDLLMPNSDFDKILKK